MSIGFDTVETKFNIQQEDGVNSDSYWFKRELYLYESFRLSSPRCSYLQAHLSYGPHVQNKSHTFSNRTFRDQYWVLYFS